MPETRAVRKLMRLGQSDLAVRRFLTFVTAMDRARDAVRLWSDAVKLLRAHPETFDPAAAAVMPTDRLRGILAAARVSQRHGPDTTAWKKIACSLSAGSDAVAHVVEHGKGDAVTLLKDLRIVDAKGRRRYPFLRGPKLGPMWVRIMAAPGGAKVDNMDIVPVAVDVHVRRVTENLGVADTAGLPLGRAKPIIQQAWKNAVDEAKFGGPEGIAGTCAALDPALWFYGKHGCGHCKKVRRRVPLGSACRLCQYVPDAVDSLPETEASR